MTQLSASPQNSAWWSASEHWAALVNDAGFGLGVVNSFAATFGGFFAGTPDIGGPTDSSTGYIAPNIREVLDWNIAYQYDYSLVLGTLDQIRAFAVSQRPDQRPSYRFSQDRQHFWYENATDTGWPIDGALHVRVNESDPQLVGPEQWWRAEDVPSVVIEAAYRTSGSQGQLFWSVPHEGFSEERSIHFTAIPDGGYHTYTLDLASSPAYKGTITGIRLDPSNGLDAAGIVDITSITASGRVKEPALAKVSSITVRGTTALIRWRGSANATTYDVGLRRIAGVWKTVRSQFQGTAYTVRGKRGVRYAVRVRARDHAGSAGPWSRSRIFVLH